MKLTILLSKQVDRVIADVGNERESDFTLQLYDVCKKGIESKPWEAVLTNSQTLSAALAPNYWPPADQYNPIALCEYLWCSTHVIAFWAGGPSFQHVLEAAHRMQRKMRLYACDMEKLSLQKIDLSPLRKPHASKEEKRPIGTLPIRENRHRPSKGV